MKPLLVQRSPVSPAGPLALAAHFYFTPAGSNHNGMLLQIPMIFMMATSVAINAITEGLKSHSGERFPMANYDPAGL